jgi:hypothetical protein
MQSGDIVRLRRTRVYGFGDDRNYFEFTPDSERKPADQACFVVMVLGCERRRLIAKPGSTEVIAEPLDVDRVYNGMGLWGEQQIVELLGKKRGEAVVRDLHKRRVKQIKDNKHVNQRLEALKQEPKGEIDIRG